MSWKETLKSALLSLLLVFGLPAVASAACATGIQTCSTSYQLNEVDFGSGGSLNSCDGANYCSKQAAGETAVGNPSSADYQIHAGFNTDRLPSLQLLVTGTNVNLGTISTTSTGTGTATFSVKSYLASGYVVQTAGTPLTAGSYTISPLGSPAASAAGSEQFGINLVANNTCGGVANGTGTITGSSAPVEVPSSTFSFGAAATGYNTACQFKYVNGDTIASSNSSSGETDYTISYIFNVKPTTPAGIYNMTQTIIATSTF